MGKENFKLVINFFMVNQYLKSLQLSSVVIVFSTGTLLLNLTCAIYDSRNTNKALIGR